MHDEGYGVKTNGKPSGIWPISLQHARKTASKYKKDNPNANVEIVSITSGNTIPVLTVIKE